MRHILFASALYLVTALPALAQLTGPLSGTVAAGDYTVIGDIYIEEDDSLVIEPGVVFSFYQDVSFTVDGWLFAAGTAADSVKFIRAAPDNPWSGIRFTALTTEVSILDYCIIEGSSSSGIYCSGGDVIVQNSLIKNNFTDESGGGLAFENSTAAISNCSIIENSASIDDPTLGTGGGISISNSVVSILNCLISEDSCSHNGAGIYVEENSEVTVSGCIISENAVYNDGGWNQGGGVYAQNSNVSIEYCQIIYNTVTGPIAEGGGICCYGTGVFSLLNSTVSRNSLDGSQHLGSGIYALTINLIVKNCIFEGNTGGYGFNFGSPVVNFDVCNNNLYNHTWGNFGDNHTPPCYEVVNTVNAKGDSCDIYQNIFFDPEFTDPANGNFQITENSPCIDAGYYDSPFDPDGTIADIGALYFDQTGSGIIIDGYCLLEGQTNHCETKVLLNAIFPPAETDSGYTYDNGYYQIVIEPGTYDVNFYHDNYEGDELLNQSLLTPVTLPTITLQMEGGIEPISGALSGVLSAGTYLVQDNLRIVSGEELIIEAGAVFYFDGAFNFEINGNLQAVGTETDSIKFLPNLGTPYWEGLDFTGMASDQCRLEYCSIRNSNSSGIRCENIGITVLNSNISSCFADYGGGIYLENSISQIEHCVFELNRVEYTSNYGNGAGICLMNSDAFIDSCIFTENFANTHGGGIYCENSDPVISNCEILYNTVDGQDGGGISLYYSNPQIVNCRIIGNYSFYGGGIIFWYSDALITDCLISENTAYCTSSGGGGGLKVHSSNPQIVNCVISNNSGTGGGISCYNANPLMRNCIMFNNSSSEVYFGGNCINTQVNYCDLYGGGFSGTGMPPEFGVIDTVNYNGIACDTFFNIFEDPLFVDPVNGNFNLQPGSPSIDAGDLCEAYNDLDGTIGDQGCYGGSRLIPGFTKLDFSEVGTSGTGRDTTWVLYNERDTDVVLTSASFSTSHFSLSGVNFPLTLSPYSSVPITVHVLPQAPGAASDSLMIFSNDLCGTESFSIHFLAEGINDYTLYGDLPAILYQAESPYRVIGDINVPTSQTTVIEPGVELLFDDLHEFIVSGTLEAVGTEQDSIKFAPFADEIEWMGMLFDSTGSSNSRMEYCVVAGSNSSGIDFYYSDAELKHCLITDNCADEGGGIRCEGGSPTIDSCAVSGNEAVDYGGGFCLVESDAALINCTISENDVTGSSGSRGGGGIYSEVCSLTIENCVICDNSGYKGGGIHSRWGSPVISNCIISNNSADDEGGGIYSSDDDLIMTNTLINDNVAADYYGGGRFLTSNQTIVTGCTFLNNQSPSRGIYLAAGNNAVLQFSNCVLYGNTAVYSAAGIDFNGTGNVVVNNCIIAGNQGGNGIINFDDDGGHYQVSFCDFHNNTGELFTGSVPDTLLGVNLAINLNGDSCDVSNNIFLDPLFVNAPGDFNLQMYSPCIDAGDPESQLDPDGTVSDIGVYYFDQLNNPFPDILLSQASIGFGQVEPGGMIETPLSIINIGSADLQIDSLVFTDYPEIFTAAWVTSDSIISPADSIELMLQFAPLAGLEYVGVLMIYGNSPAAAVSLSGIGLAPMISISADTVNFYTCLIEDTSYYNICVYNLGTTDLMIDTVFIEELPFIFGTTWTTDDSLIIAGDSLQFDVTFTPLEMTEYQDNLFIFNNDFLITLHMVGQGDTVLSVSQSEPLIPEVFALHNPQPNPFNPSAKILFDLPNPCRVSLVIYDITGRKTAMLVNDYRPPGYYAVTFNASNLSSGIYFARLTAGDYTQTRKLLLVK